MGTSRDKPGFFDRFAERTTKFVAEAPFFAACVLLVVIWIPTYPFAGNFDTWQLLINTPTTVVTFLLVALLQNSTRRNELALQSKLDALAKGVAEMMEHELGDDPAEARRDLEQDLRELRQAVGLEKRVSA